MAQFNRLLNLIPARQRLTEDPLTENVKQARRFSPVPILRLKLTSNLHRDVLSRREEHEPFTIDRSQRLAVVIPFRDREEHLFKLLPALRRSLDQQNIDYRIVVVEQEPGKLFNRAKNINVGADVAGNEADYFCFHDVDMYPEKAEYGCPSQPFRLVKRLTQTFRSVPEFTGYYFSGAISIRKEQFIAANGFANDYWGSGSQDEDFFYRLLLKGFVPYEDLEGVFGEFDNPNGEIHYRTRRIRRGNKRRMIWHCYRRTLGQSGINDLSYRLIDRNEHGPVIRLRVSI
jgi:hypothetical protein